MKDKLTSGDVLMMVIVTALIFLPFALLGWVLADILK